MGPVERARARVIVGGRLESCRVQKHVTCRPAPRAREKWRDGTESRLRRRESKNARAQRQRTPPTSSQRWRSRPGIEPGTTGTIPGEHGMIAREAQLPSVRKVNSARAAAAGRVRSPAPIWGVGRDGPDLWRDSVGVRHTHRELGRGPAPVVPAQGGFGPNSISTR